LSEIIFDTKKLWDYQTWQKVWGARTPPVKKSLSRLKQVKIAVIDQ
jgi:hypothetical protein